MKVNDQKTLINRVFTAGYWLDMMLEDGIGRLRDYPELMEYPESLSRFKRRFLQFFEKRDAYLHDMQVTCHGKTSWPCTWSRTCLDRTGQRSLRTCHRPQEHGARDVVWDRTEEAT